MDILMHIIDLILVAIGPASAYGFVNLIEVLKPLFENLADIDKTTQACAASCIANVIEYAGIVALSKNYLWRSIQHVEQVFS